MIKKYLFNILILTFLCSMSCVSFAAPSFDTANMVGHMKELVYRETRNELLEQGGEFVKSANALVTATSGVLKTIEQISGKSMTPVEEWSPIVPKSVAKLLEAEEPDLEKIEAELEKLILIDRTSSETLKQTIDQQKVMMLKILSYAYAAAERSLDLSGDAYEETQELKKKIEEHEDIVTHVRQMAVLQMFSTRKMAEILHLHSRMLEVDSIVGIIKKERPDEDDEDDDTTSSSDSSSTSSSTSTNSDGESSASSTSSSTNTTDSGTSK